MKKIGLVLTIIFLFTMPILSYSTELLIDDAGLLSEYEREKLSDLLETRSAEVGFSIAVVTVEDYHDYYSTDRYEGGILLLISMAEREFYLETIGFAHDVIDDYKLADVEDAILGSLTNGDYYGAFCNYANKVAELASEHETPSEKGIGEIGEKLLISLVIGLIISFILVTIKKRGMTTVRAAKGASDYVVHNSLNITHRNDRYLYSTVTRTRKSDSSNGSRGRSRGRRSGRF